MITAEHSYFNFLMEYRRARRVRIPFAQAVGVMPERTPFDRACLVQPARREAEAPRG